MNAALLDESPAGKLLARYAGEASRLKRRALDDLDRHRRRLEAAGETPDTPLTEPERAELAALILGTSADAAVAANPEAATPPADPPPAEPAPEAPAPSEPEPAGEPLVLEPVAIDTTGPIGSPMVPVEPPAALSGPPPTAG